VCAFLIILNCDKSGLNCDSIKGYQGYQGHPGHPGHPDHPGHLSHPGLVSLFHQPTRHECGSALQNANLYDNYEARFVILGGVTTLGKGKDYLFYNYESRCGILGGDTILGKGKDYIFYNFNSVSYLRDQIHNRFKHSFTSIRVKMAELGPFEILLHLLVHFHFHFHLKVHLNELFRAIQKFRDIHKFKIKDIRKFRFRSIRKLRAIR
jgi:hypothetical protein